MRALYDYFMHGVKHVEQANQDTDTPWPLSMRWPLTVWRWAFAEEGVYTPIEGKADD